MFAKIKIKKNHHLICKEEDGLYRFWVKKLLPINDKEMLEKLGWKTLRTFMGNIVVIKSFYFTPETIAAMAGFVLSLKYPDFKIFYDPKLKEKFKTKENYEN